MCRKCELVERLAEKKSDATIVRAVFASALPENLAVCTQFVELTRAVVEDSCRQDVAFEARCGERDSLELLDDVQQCLRSFAASADTMPVDKESHAGFR